MSSRRKWQKNTLHNIRFTTMISLKDLLLGATQSEKAAASENDAPGFLLDFNLSQYKRWDQAVYMQGNV